MSQVTEIDVRPACELFALLVLTMPLAIDEINVKHQENHNYCLCNQILLKIIKYENELIQSAICLSKMPS